MVAPLMPAVSPGVSSSICVLKPLRSAYFRYWRSSMLAQSQASVPPAPAWMSMKALSGSAGLLNIRRNSSCLMSASSAAASSAMDCRPSMSPSSFDISKSSVLSDSPLVRRSSVTTTSSSDFFSLPSSWAFFGSFQTFGSSSDALTVLSRSALAS
ncbi:Uncharacterised protein [Mycobacterium tuberculosis]|nr:Uncharacterised protein [Mycobacterium tuberculosis]